MISCAGYSWSSISEADVCRWRSDAVWSLSRTDR